MIKSQNDLAFAVSLLTKALGKRGLALMGAATILVLVTSFLITQPPLIIGAIVTEATSSGLGAASTSLMMLASIVVLQQGLMVGQRFLVERAAVGIQHARFTDLVGKLFDLEVVAVQDRRVGDITTRIDRSVNGLTRLLKLAFLDLFPSLAAAVFAMAFAFVQHWVAGLAMLVAIIITASITAVQLSTQRGIRLHLLDSRAALAGKVGEMLSNLGFVRVAWLAQNETLRLGSDARNVAAVELRHHRAMIGFDAIKQIVETCGLIAVMIVGLSIPIGHPAFPGDVLALVLLYARVSMPIQILHRVVDEGQESVLSIAAMRRVDDMPRDKMLLGGKSTGAAGSEVVACEKLSVSYGDSDSTRQSVVTRLDLLIVAGECVGIVGPTGCGKSTLVKVMLGLVAEFDGTARIFGVDIGEVDKADLARRVCYLPQEPFIVAGTLRQNLLLREPLANDDQLRGALSLACAPEDGWSEGLDTVIHEAGKNISGGQRQRLSIARAFLSTCDLYVLDEATSQLDAVTEKQVIEALHLRRGTGTIIAIAHRLASLAPSTRILVMESGQIVQDGGFDQLAAQEGLFAALAQASALVELDRAA